MEQAKAVLIVTPSFGALPYFCTNVSNQYPGLLVNNTGDNLGTPFIYQSDCVRAFGTVGM